MRLSIWNAVAAVQHHFGHEAPRTTVFRNEDGRGKREGQKLFQTTIDTSAARKSDNEAEVRSSSATFTRRWATVTRALLYDVALNSVRIRKSLVRIATRKSCAR